MSGIEELLTDSKEDSSYSIGDIRVDDEFNVVIDPVDSTDENHICHLSDLPDRDVDDDTLQTLKAELDELNCRPLNSEQHPDVPSSLAGVDLYRLTVDEKDRLVLPLSSQNIPLYHLTDTDDKLDCPELRDRIEDDEELFRMIEYTRESENDSYFYVTENFDTIAVVTGETESYSTTQEPLSWFLPSVIMTMFVTPVFMSILFRYLPSYLELFSILVLPIPITIVFVSMTKLFTNTDSEYESIPEIFEF